MDDHELVRIDESQPESFREELDVEIGQWYWVNDGEEPWLGCIVRIGSNFVKLESPRGEHNWSHSARVLFSEFDETLKHEPNAREVIQSEIDKARNRVEQGLARVKEITARLGVSNKMGIDYKDGESNRSLSVMSGSPDISGYKNDLIKAKDDDLPKAFEQIEEANKDLTKWMSAESVPMLALARRVKDCVNDIEDRIFNVTLYAGLTEEIHQVSNGEPADFAEPLHLMQRRLYMDEECLINYKHGGMDFNGIEKFDKWLRKSDNFNRVFPFQRCIVAFRVRRENKHREWDGRLLSIFIKLQLEEADKTTFLYIRNGERLYRMNCDLEFGDKIFPDKSEFDPSEPMMVKMFASRVDDIMPKREFDDRLKEWKELDKQIKEEKRIREKWLEEVLGPEPERDDYPDTIEGLNQYYHDHNEVWRKKLDECPFGGYWHRTRHDWSPHGWEPIDQDNVYFDECVEEVEKRLKQYNRIALIVQGLFDRSECLHPHPPVKVWDPDSFNKSIVMVYDGSNILYDGDAPDFEEYRQRGLAALNKDSVVIGQELAWLKKEAEKENNRLDNDWRIRTDHRHETFRPYGNNGPGYIAKMYIWRPKIRQAVFMWYRDRLGGYGPNKIKTTVTVNADDLFNISAYTPGDYKKFYEDPRTRAEYLEWAPLLLSAEEYHAGNMVAQEPGEYSGERITKRRWIWDDEED